jgi:tetratricopeptide (TPR) repeat protein
MKESNDKAAAANKMIASINTDLQTANQDFEDALNARATAIRTLGSTASASDVDSMAYEIKVSKYTEIESLMSKAATESPGEASLWIYLGRAQVGLKNYLDAETSFKKAVELTSKAGNPGPQVANIDPQLAGAANAGLGEVYARTLMVDEANAFVAAAVKADPAHAATYLRNLAVIFFQEKNALAQIDAADEAIKANPNDAVLYFIKAQGLAVDAPIDPDTNKIKLSPECVAAFRKYLELSPAGEYAAQVTSILKNADLQSTDPRNTGIDTGAASAPAEK